MRRFIPCVILPLLLAVSVQAEVIPFTVEVGYRWTNVNGNELQYRSQTNEQSGFLLRAFTMVTPGLRIDGTDLGAGPASAFRLQADRTGLYRFRLGYRSLDAFSALPGFANPLLTQGIIAGQHTLDRTRTVFDADLEFLPDHKFTPFIGYSFNKNSGPGTSTYFIGQDEFRMLQDLNEKDHELRLGASFQYSSVYGQLTQGWRQFRGDESLALAPGAGSGNNLTPILGQPINANELRRVSKTSVDTPFTNLYVAATPVSRLRLIGNYSRFSAETTPSGDETALGSFVSFPLSRDFTGLTETVSGKAKNLTWRGGARAEYTVASGVDLFGGYQRDSRELDGSSLINTLYTQAVTFGGLDRKDLQTVLDATNALRRSDDIYSLGASARIWGPFALRVEFKQANQDLTISPDLSEIVVPGSQGGDFNRRVRTLDTGVTYSKAGFQLAGSWRGDRANDAVFRTDFVDRDRYRARAGWASKSQRFAAGLTAEQVKQSNDTEIGFDAKLRQYTADVEFAPVTKLRLRGGYSQYKADTSILFRRPETFTTDTSIHTEDGRSTEGGFTLLFPRTMIDSSFARFKNQGSIPLTLDRIRARATFDLKAKLGLGGEWSRDKYRETNLAIANYDADRFALFVRWTQ